MTRADIRTLVWLAPLAVVLAIGWLFRADPCLDNEIGKRLREMNPPEVVTREGPSAPDAVVVDNPYGISTCHYWPDGFDHVISFGTLGVIALLIGFLSARNFQQRARVRAAMVIFATVSLAGAFSLLVYLPDYADFIERKGYGLLFQGMSLVLGVALGAAMVAWFAAVITQKMRSP